MFPDCRIMDRDPRTLCQCNITPHRGECLRAGPTLYISLSLRLVACCLSPVPLSYYPFSRHKKTQAISGLGLEGNLFCNPSVFQNVFVLLQLFFQPVFPGLDPSSNKFVTRILSHVAFVADHSMNLTLYKSQRVLLSPWSKFQHLKKHYSENNFVLVLLRN